MTDREKCLKFICEFDASSCFGAFYTGVTPCTLIARETKVSLYKVRKIMKQLAEDGYVYKNCVGGYDDYNYKVTCIHGYSLTDKAKDTDYYKLKYEQEEEYIRREVCGGRFMNNNHGET